MMRFLLREQMGVERQLKCSCRSSRLHVVDDHLFDPDARYSSISTVRDLAAREGGMVLEHRRARRLREDPPRGALSVALEHLLPRMMLLAPFTMPRARI